MTTVVDAFVRDSFGEEVVAALFTHCAVAVLPWEQAWAPSTWRPDATLILASMTPDPPLEDFMNRVALDLRRSWLSIVLESRYLRVGPAIAAGADGCHECFRARQRQHRAVTEIDAAVDGAHAGGLSYSRPAMGYLPSHVNLASTLTNRALQEIRDDDATLGRAAARSWPIVYRVGLSHTRLEEFRVTPVHNCPACSPSVRRSAEDATSVAGLRELDARLSLGAERR